MNPLLSRVLEGDEEAIAQFGEADHCAVIDGHDGPAEIVATVAAFLPDGHLALGRVTSASCEFVVSGKPGFVVPLSPRATQENLLLGIDRAIRPEYGLRQFRPIDGDGYSIFVAPMSVWSQLERVHPEATERFFLGAQRLAAYWSKPYLARVFSKP